MPDSQTVEDLGKLVKSKYPKTYDSLSDVELGQKVKGKYPDAYGSFSDMPASAMSRFGTGVYNSTVGPLVNAVQHPIDTISNIAGIPQYKEAFNQARQGNYLPAAQSLEQAVNPAERMAQGTVEPIAQDIKSGNYAGALGQGVGTLGTLAAGAYAPESRLGQAAGAGIKAAAPDMAMGGLRAGVAGTIGESIPHGGFVMANQTYKGLQQAGEGLQKGARAFGEAWKGPKVEPPSPPPIPTKGPSIGDFKTAVAKGTMTPEAFDASIDKMSDLTPEAKNLHKANVRASQTTPVKFPVTSPKTLNLGQLQKSVESGRMSIEDFTGEVKKLGYTEEHANELTEQLKDSLKEEKEAEEAKKAKSTSEPKEKPKNQTKAPEVKTEAPKVKPLEVKPPSETSNPQGPKVEPPKSRRSPDRPYEDPDNPLYRGPINETQIEEAQSMDRAAKETTLARHLIKNKIDLDSIPKTGEFLKAISKEAGLKRVASLQTLEGAIRRAKKLK